MSAVRLLCAGADIYATGARGCTALDLLEQQRIPLWIWDTLFQGRSYGHCRTYLMQAHADCQRRAKDAVEYTRALLSCAIRAMNWASCERCARCATRHVWN